MSDRQRRQPTGIGREIIRGLEELNALLASGRPIEGHYRVTNLVRHRAPNGEGSFYTFEEKDREGPNR